MKQFLLALILGGILYAAPHGLTKAEANQPLTAEDKIALQSALLDFFEQGGDADGTFRIIDRTTGDMLKMHTDALHPRIITLGPDYVVCIQLFDTSGQGHEADFVMRRGSGGWIVTDVLLNQRDLLKKARSQLK